MHDLGTPPSPGPPAPAAEDPDVPLWVLALGVVVALVLVGALTVLVLRDEEPPASAPAGVTHPDRWDKRVRPYVRVVEDLRGLEFRHPVTVRFLPERRFEKTVTSEEEELTAADRRELESATGTLRALGLVDAKLDLFGAVNETSGAGIAAYYSFDDQRITVRGTRLAPEVRSTLVHELVHALQDQHFGIGGRTKTLHEASEDAPDSTAGSVLEAVVEGDAMWVERLYRESLDERGRRSLDAGSTEEAREARRRLSEVPDIVVTLMTAAYPLGNGLVEVAAADGGHAAVDDLLEKPPTHDRALLDPLETLAGDVDVRTLRLLKVGEGEKEFASGTLGAVMWYLMLAERLPVEQALTAVDGWAGDTYLAYETGGRSCVRLEIAGESRAAADTLHGAVRRWAAPTPRVARVTRDGEVVRLETCDPGRSAPRPNDASQEAIGLVVRRAGVGLGLLQGGVPGYQTPCLADALVRNFSAEQLADPDFGADEPATVAQLQRLAARCR